MHAVNSFLRSFYNDPITQLWKQKTVENGSGEGEGSSGENSLEDKNAESSPFQRAIECLRAHKYDNIITLCDEELNKQENIEARLLRGTFKYLSAYRKETLVDLDIVINSSASNKYKSSALIKKACYMSLLGDNDSAFEECFHKAEELWPENVDLWHHRGQVRMYICFFVE